MIPSITFFNSKAGVGKTSLVYHMAWMYADQGHRVLAVDLDPQVHFTAAMVDEARLEQLTSVDGLTIASAISPLLNGASDDIAVPHLEEITPRLALVAGDPLVAGFEDELALAWLRCLERKEHAFGVISAFHRAIQRAAFLWNADLVLVDLGPTLGAINRAALVACQYIVVPVAPDALSMRGLSSLGPTIRRWALEWNERRPMNPVPTLEIPRDVMMPAGYVVLEPSVRLDRPVQDSELWMSRIPQVYAATVLDAATSIVHPSADPRCLGRLKRYGSLMPMAREARKPIFHLRPSDGALGAHATAAREARADFQQVADRIARATWRSPAPS